MPTDLCFHVVISRVESGTLIKSFHPTLQTDSTTFVACNAPQSAVCSGAGNKGTVTIPSLAVGASITATISASINISVTPGTIISDTASMISTVPDFNPNNDAQTAFTTARVASGPVQNGLIAFQSDGGTGISGAIEIYITNSASTGQANITSEDAGKHTTSMVAGWERTQHSNSRRKVVRSF